MFDEQKELIRRGIHDRLSEKLGGRYDRGMRLRVDALLDRYDEMTRDELVVEAVEAGAAAMLAVQALASYIEEFAGGGNTMSRTEPLH